MTNAGLGYINSQLELLEIPYQFMEWTSDVVNTYFIGECHEQSPNTEDGLQESDFILTGTTRDKYIALENIKEKLRNHFTTDGISTILSNGNGIVVSYDIGGSIPSIEEGIHRIQITLKVKEWRV